MLNRPAKSAQPKISSPMLHQSARFHISDDEEKIYQARMPYWEEVQPQYEQYGHMVSERIGIDNFQCGICYQWSCHCSMSNLNEKMSKSWEEEMMEWDVANYQQHEDDESDVRDDIREMEFREWMLEQYFKDCQREKNGMGNSSKKGMN